MILVKQSKSLTLHYCNLMGLPSTLDCFYGRFDEYRIYGAAKYLFTHTTEYLLPKEGLWEPPSLHLRPPFNLQQSHFKSLVTLNAAASAGVFNVEEEHSGGPPWGHN